ncbi:energy-coupling factor transporter ATPase [Ligilactobacillus cholophilus]|uniref:energy-coupling factor transporter ATPase n=1 Tax=Ligilactobacillus cholophilus TaxID=3050131 RepID=UPI0025B0CFB2|nr:energy-coupling factor transporter ATPase [Ligilactobacillus cholophilus]
MESIIEVENLTYEYEDFKLGPIDLMIKPDEWVSIIGPNGSGKSTFIRLLDGLLESKTGSISIDGQIVNEENIWHIRSNIGMVFQNPDNQFVGANVEDDVAFGLENRNISHSEMVSEVNQALKMVGMDKFKKHEPSKLSGGQKQRVAIAGVLAIHPKIVILDEATSMLDPEGRRNLLKLIHELKEEYHFTVIAITHDVDEVVDADRVVVMNKGKILMDDTPSNIFNNPNELIEIGLELPFAEKLSIALSNNQIEITDSYLNEKELADKLWELNSKM